MAEIARSADMLVDLITSNPEFLAAVKADPEKILPAIAKTVTKSLPPPALVGDKLVYRIVAGSLGVVAIAAVIGAIWLSLIPNTAIPDVLTALGAAAIGAMAGLLAPSPK